MIEIADISLPVSVHPLAVPCETGVCDALLASLSRAGMSPVRTAIRDLRVARVGIDARHVRDVHFVVTLVFSCPALGDEQEVLKRLRAAGLKAKPFIEAPALQYSRPGGAAPANQKSPVIVGAGPAGLFCAYALALGGLHPLLVERGGSVSERVAALDRLQTDGILDESCNAVFGEGGAGTFSDGKLNTGITSADIPAILKTFVACGADEDITRLAHPHVGTDVLRRAIPELRHRIEQAGAQVRFHTRLDAIAVSGGRVRGVICADAEPLAGTSSLGVSPAQASGIQQTDSPAAGQGSARRTTACSQVVLACGHSARDTFAMLERSGINLERKPFSMGVRIEHPQAAINAARYGGYAQAAAHSCPELAAADYRLVHHCADGRGVYTFCMCPGGEVVCASSESGEVAVNGMSNAAREGENANAALLVDVRPDDFGPAEAGPLAGVDLQRRVEQAAFQAALTAGGKPYQAPAQRVGDFLAAVRERAAELPVIAFPAGDGSMQEAADGSLKCPEQAAGKAGVSAPSAGLPARGVAAAESASDDKVEVRASYARGVVACNLVDILPAFVSADLAEGLGAFARKLSAFANPNALMTGVETRSSSPVRIVRDESGMASVRGLFPAGEGAGYAGGIMSACVDGLKAARAVVRERAAVALKRGQAVVFPTDTVMGLGVAVKYAPTPAVLYQIKQRPSDKPIAWLVDSPEALLAYGRGVPAYAMQLAERYWPGALTLVVRAGRRVPAAYTSAQGTIALRMPKSASALNLISQVGCPLATTSANISGEKAPSWADEVDERIVSQVAWVLADAQKPSGIASTVIDCTGDSPRIIRQGSVVITR